MTELERLATIKKNLERAKDTGMGRVGIQFDIDYLLHVINLAQYGQYFLNMRDLNEGPKADEFMEKATAQALETGHIPTFAEYYKMMHEDVAK